MEDLTIKMLMSARKYYVNANGSKAEVLKVYESFNGWYWFLTEFDKDDPEVAFGLVKGFETEWGSVWLPELKHPQIWEVDRKNWIGLPLGGFE